MKLSLLYSLKLTRIVYISNISNIVFQIEVRPPI